MIEPFPLSGTCERHSKALAYADAHIRVSYGALLEHVERRVASLSLMGIGARDRVVWCPQNDLETLLSFWSLFALGAIACPISPRFPTERQREIANRLGAKWLPAVTDTADRRDAMIDAMAPATIMLSSGSSGEPKAIVHSLQAHIASAVGAQDNMPLYVGDRWLWSLPAYHVSGLSILFRCALAGATICGVHGSQELNVAILDDANATHLSAVAIQLSRLMKDNRFSRGKLKAILLGGGAVPTALIRKARERRLPVRTTYGLTEMASQVTTSSSDANDVVTCGRVLPCRELKIDETSEILVRGETLCLGYDRKGRVEPIVDEDGWFHTGDLGRIESDDELFVTGRMDNMFISGGENIFPENIERALLELPGIEQAIVVPRDDEEFGARPIVFVDASLDDVGRWTEAMRAHLRGFEVPVAFLAWPNDVQHGIKPSRAKLRELGNQST